MNKTRSLIKYQIIFVFLLSSASFIIGCVGINKYYLSISEARSFLDITYLSMQMFIVQLGDMPGAKSFEFEVARWLSPALAAYAFLLASISIFYEQIKALKICCAKNHVIICGLGEKSLMLAKKFLLDKNKYQVIIIEVNPENEHIDTIKSLGAMVVIGNANDENILREVKLDTASHLIALCGSDSVNAEISVLADEIKKVGNDLNCYIHISDNKLCNFFQMHGLNTSLKNYIKIDYFNFYHIGAYSLLRKYPFSFNENDSQNGVLVVGLGKIGEVILIDLIFQWKKIYKPDSNKKLKVIVIDMDCVNKLNMMKAKIPEFDQICDIMPLQTDIRSAEFYKGEYLYSNDKNCIINKAYVCLNSDSDSLLAALTLSSHLDKHKVEIAMSMNSNNGFAKMFQNSKTNGNYYSNIKIMGLLDEVCIPDIVIGGNYERLAKSIHEEYCKKEKAKGNDYSTNKVLIEWEKLSDEDKESNRAQARKCFAKLKKGGYSVTIMTDLNDDEFNFNKEDLELMAEYEHERWMAEKLKNGWKYGLVKDSGQKTHPCIIAYEKLSEEEKQKDRDTVIDLPQHLAMIGLKIYKEIN